MLKKLFEKINEYFRIIKLASKPDKEELLEMIKISLIGIGVLGFIGFLFLVIFSLIL
ncbi:MAG: protein translocase SEC61 complex subunit gamma [Candidatus Aenigmarchaeota archaeon]|nr:protein translocase SEC61 complex subunit gamma [Candidatus Aenigmarchaeota archaeon]MDW8149632.1 protein translocase SEC61 complex subunit gamma [Candidatus Aenigmarchaeota archaeon]